MRRRGSVVSQITNLLMYRAGIGIFLAILSQFGGDIGAFVKWILQSMWNFVIMVRDIFAGSRTFGELFR